MNEVDRFWSKVDKAGDCWVWTGGASPKGYGIFHVKGHPVRAHRYSYALHHGPIPETDDEGNRIVVRHKCDNPPCVNPAHLELGTYADNLNDMRERGRSREGAYLRARTHCPQRHEYDEANTIHYRGMRYCRTCRDARYQAKKQAA